MEIALNITEMYFLKARNIINKQLYVMCRRCTVKICLLFTSLRCCESLDEERAETKEKEGGDLGVRAKGEEGVKRGLLRVTEVEAWRRPTH